jgi:hypothetical protein
MEELIREPGESGSPTEKLEAARFIAEVVGEGDWAETQGAVATSRAIATTRVRWARCMEKAGWLCVALKIITSLSYGTTLSGYGSGDMFGPYIFMYEGLV